MTMAENFDSLYQPACYLNLSLFVLLLFSQIAVMILIKSFSLLDRSAIVTLTTYTGCLLLRFLMWIDYLRTG